MYIETVFSIFVNISILQNTWFKFSDASESKTVPCYKVSWCQVLKSKRGGFKLYNTFRRHKYRCQNGTVQALAVYLNMYTAYLSCLNLLTDTRLLVCCVCRNVKRNTICRLNVAVKLLTHGFTSCQEVRMYLIFVVYESYIWTMTYELISCYVHTIIEVKKLAEAHGGSV